MTPKFLIFILILAHCQVRAQEGSGGTTSLFSDAGVGARALSMGGAFAALSDDPTAVFWNPAGLDFIERKSASSFYSGLDFGTSYNFVGAVFPTLSFGSFGIGWTRFSTNDIRETDPEAFQTGTGDFGANQFYFSYGKQLRRTFSLGITAKLERTNFDLDGGLSDTGVGFDLGVLYRPEFDAALLRDVSVGVNAQNLISPRARLESVTESSPLNLKAGIAKLFVLGEERNLFRLLLDVNKSENASLTVHAGGEYSFRDQANVRFGVNDGQVAFGAGAAYNNIRLDYNFGKFADGSDFSANHRFSVTIDIGKSKQERIRLAQERREREFRLQLENELWFNGESEFNNSMEEGREKYYNRDYLGAYVAFSNAFEAGSSLQEIAMRLRGQDGDNPEANMRVETANSSLQEARTMLELANARSDSVRREEQKTIVLQARESALEQELQDFLIEHKEKGIEFFKAKFYSRAIREWQLAVDRINRTASEGTALPDWVGETKAQLENNIATAERQLKGNLQETIRRAESLARRGQYVQALDELNQVRGSGLTTAERQSIERRIQRLQAQLSYNQSYEEGLRHYRSKRWPEAVTAFEQALRSRPDDADAIMYRDRAQARAIATVQPMPANVRAKLARSVIFLRTGEYQKALDVLEEIRQLQPYNKIILDRIDGLRERLGNDSE